MNPPPPISPDPPPEDLVPLAEGVMVEVPAAPVPDFGVPPPEADSFWHGLRALPRVVWVVAAGLFINRIGTMIWPLLTVYVETHFGSSATGPVLVSLGLGSLAASLLAGHAADTLGRKVCVLTSSFTAGVAALALSQAQNLPAMMALTAALGFATSIGWPGLNALVAESVPVSRRPQAVALSRLAVNLGFAFGPSLAGWLAASSFFLVFFCDSLTWFLFGLIALVGIPAKEVVVRDWGRFRQVLPSLAESFRAARADRGLVRFLSSQLLATLIFTQFGTTFSLVMRDAGCSLEQYGLVMGAQWPRHRVLNAPHRLCGAPSLGAPGCGGDAAVRAGFLRGSLHARSRGFAALMFVLTVGEMLWIPAASLYVTNAASDELRGRYQGLSGFTWSLSGVLGPAGGVMLYHASPVVWGGSALVLACLGAALAAGLRDAAGVPLRRPWLTR
ncbi:MAG: MFS transporter [Verrucomicrobiales bacterium]